MDWLLAILLFLGLLVLVAGAIGGLSWLTGWVDTRWPRGTAVVMSVIFVAVLVFVLVVLFSVSLDLARGLL